MIKSIRFLEPRWANLILNLDHEIRKTRMTCAKQKEVLKRVPYNVYKKEMENTLLIAL
jgi:hypothetical protein